MTIESLDDFEKKSARPLNFIEFDQIEPCLENIDFIEDLLCEGNVSVVYGAPKSGKTFFTVDMALKLSASMKFYDQEVDGGCVLYIGLEGQKAITNRIAAFKKHHEIEAPLPFRFVTEQIDLLSSKNDANRIVDLIMRTKKELNKLVRLVIIDTWARATPGNQENTGDTNAAFANVDYIKDKTNAHVCLVHHSGKDENSGARGSNIMIANPDLVVRVTKDKTTKIHTAKIEETRWADNQGKEFNFMIEGVDLGKNRREKIVSSGVVVPTDVGPSSHKLSGQPLQAYRLLCDLLCDDKLIRRTKPKAGMDVQNCISIDDFKENFAKAGISETDVKTSVDKAFNRARQKLKTLGFIGEWDGLIWITDKADKARHP